MTRGTILLAVLLLLLSGGYLAVDRQLTELVRSELENAALSDLVEFRELHIEPFDHAVVRDATLRDPVTGQAVGHVDELIIDIELDIGWDGETHFDIAGLRGRGGQALLALDDGTLTLARSISELITRIEAMLPPGEPGAAPGDTPPLTFEDIDVLVHANGQAIDRFLGTTGRILDIGSEILVQIQTEQGDQVARRAGRRSTLVAAGALQEGEAQLLFSAEGTLVRVESRGFRVSPALIQLEPNEGIALARELEPYGLLDMVALRGENGELTVNGTLRDGSLSIPVLGFDLHPAAIPFRVLDGVGSVDRAEVDFAGGRATVTLDDREDGLALELDLVDAEFREEFLDLLPFYSELGMVSCEDGGLFELHLNMRFPSGQTVPDISGEGGFHVLDVRVDTPVGPLQLSDVVGSFRADEQQLEFPEVSAHLASGVLRGHATVAAADRTYAATLFVEDVDLAQLEEQLGVLDRAGGEVSGWLEGRVDVNDTPGISNTFNGFVDFSVRAGDLWDTPLLEAILLALPGANNGAAGRQSLEGRLSLLPDRITVDALRIASDVFTLDGAGQLDWDGRIDMEFAPAYQRLWWFGRFVQWIQQEILFNLRVEGRLLQPRVVVIPVNLVTGWVRDSVNKGREAPGDND